MDKTLSMILAGSAIFVFSACQVDSDYNLEKLDTKVTILKNAEFPVPDMTPFKLGDYLDLDGYEYIVCDEKGDYQVSFALEPMTATVTLPDLGDQDRIQTNYKPVVYGFDAIPDFLYSQDGQIAPDLSEMEVHVEMDSEIPAEFSIGSTIETLRSGAVQHKYVIDNLPIRQGKNDYWLMEEPTRENGIAVPGLGNLLSPFPDALKMSELTVYSTADQRALVSPGTEYGLTLKASVSSPVCFKADNRFTLSFPIDAKLDLEQVGLKQAILYLDYENTIPLNFSPGCRRQASGFHQGRNGIGYRRRNQRIHFCPADDPRGPALRQHGPGIDSVLGQFPGRHPYQPGSADPFLRYAPLAS